MDGGGGEFLRLEWAEISPVGSHASTSVSDSLHYPPSRSRSARVTPETSKTPEGQGVVKTDPSPGSWTSTFFHATCLLSKLYTDVSRSLRPRPLPTVDGGSVLSLPPGSSRVRHPLRCRSPPTVPSSSPRPIPLRHLTPLNKLETRVNVIYKTLGV